MARPCTRRNAEKTPTNSIGILKPIPAVFRAITATLASTPSLLGRYIDKDLQKATKFDLKLFVKHQKHGQL